MDDQGTINALKAIRAIAIEDLMATSDDELMQEIAEAEKKSALDECLANGDHQRCYRVRCNLGKRCAAAIASREAGKGMMGIEEPIITNLIGRRKE